jgi:hypothetical protein
MKNSGNEWEAKLRLFERLLISYNDFKQAWEIADYIARHKLHDKVERLSGSRRRRIQLLWQALNCSMVVSYCRPFCGNTRRSARRVPDLPGRFVKALNPNERELHAVAMEDRNKLLAHSDPDAWNMRAFLLESAPGRKMLVPLSSDVRAPLVHDAVVQLRDMCGKLMELVFQERMTLEKDLADVLPVVTADDLRCEKPGEKAG